MFSDLKYITDFKDKHVFPKIHDNIFNLITSSDLKGTFLDLGACTRLLSKRLNEHGYDVVAVEGYKEYTNIAIYPVKHLYINNDTLPQFKELLKTVDVVVARRVIPELYDTFQGNLTKLIDILKEVKYIVLEGRIVSLRSTHKLKSIEEEIKLFSKYFNVEKTYKNCALLRRKI